LANICLIGKHLLKEDFLSNELDAPLFLQFASSFSKVFLIYQTDRDALVTSRYKNIHIYLIPRKPRSFDTLYFIGNVVRLGQKLYKKYGIDILNASEPFGAGIAGIGLKHLIKKRFVLQIQGECLGYPPETHSWLKRKLAFFITKIVASLSDRIRCVSNGIYEQAIRAGITEKKLFFIGPRCNTDVFDPERTKVHRMLLRKQFGFSDNLVLIFMSALLPDKGIWEFFHAFNLLHLRHPQVRAMVVGDGPVLDELRRTVTKRKLDSQIVFCGRVDHSEIPSYLSAGDIFVFPSRHEGMPRAVLEAMSMELPVVATPVGGVPEVIKDGETGILLKSLNPNDIVEAVERLLKTPELAKTTGKNARDLVVSRYDFYQKSEELVQFHLDLLAQTY